MPDKTNSKNMDLSQPFMLGEWLVEPAIERIRKGDLEEKVEPRVMDLLTCLASNPGEVISREEVESKVWSGMVVGYDALTSAMIKLRKAFHDDSKHPQIIQTVSKRGYRLMVDVSPVSSAAEKTSHFLPDVIKNIDDKRLRLGLWAGLGIIFLGLIYSLNRHDVLTASIQSANTKIPAIIVLPFVNRSGDPEQEYFSDGITEDIITDLSRISNLQVLARNTSFRYKGEVVKPKDIGKKLNVQYLLEGSIRKQGKQLRVNAQLIDTQSGYQVWAERFDRKLVEVFAVQDELTRNIIDALAIQLTLKEQKGFSRDANNNFEVYDLFLQGRRYYSERTRETNVLAQDAFKEAIKLDPSYARAYGALASTISIATQQGWVVSPVEHLDRALVLAKKAIALDSSLPQVYWSLGYVYMFRGEYDKAAKAVETAINIAPNYADGYGLLALINNRMGNGDKAVRLITKGMKLNPHYSWDYPYNLGRGYYTRGNSGDYEAAVEQLNLALERNEAAVMARLFLAASYSALGMQDDAEWAVEQVLNNNPDMSVGHLVKISIIDNKKIRQTYLAHLRKAGLPE
jgi:TolB-like protein/DNA-binding winged helix-turn-helix (wHTH) protein/Tfp pilus assembly protein PilF